MMKRLRLKKLWLALVGALILVIPAITTAQMGQADVGPPPVEPPLVREADLAIELVSALGMGVADDEIEAVSLLAERGVSPKNGWIADYPVTPDIAGELRDAVASAADAGKLSMDGAEALRQYDDVLAGLDLPVVPEDGDIASETGPSAREVYVDADVIHNYYYSEGPPIVTYYSPPPAYISLYAWIPYPFWTSGFLFPGFFILQDFHRTVYFHDRPVFITNHYRHERTHRLYRVHPERRYRGDVADDRRGHRGEFVDDRPGRRSFNPDNVHLRDKKFSDGRRPGSPYDDRAFRPRSPSPDNRSIRPRPPVRDVIIAPSRGPGRGERRSLDRARDFNPPVQGGRGFRGPSTGGGVPPVDIRERPGSQWQGSRPFDRPTAIGEPTIINNGGSRMMETVPRHDGPASGGRGRR